MARDAGLEEVMRGHLAALPDLGETSMFGGRAWLLGGHLLCGARTDRVMVRLGKDNAGWALALPGITQMQSGSRPMPGWVWVEPEVFGDDALAARLIAAAIACVRALPPKDADPGTGPAPRRRSRRPPPP